LSDISPVFDRAIVSSIRGLEGNGIWPVLSPLSNLGLAESAKWCSFVEKQSAFNRLQWILRHGKRVTI
jgi:hypothetical protein